MNISINKKTKTENSENVTLDKLDRNILVNTNLPFSELLQNQINSEGTINISNDKMSDIDFCYEAMSMDINDALFFINLAQDGQFSLQSMQNGDFQNLIKLEASQNILTQKTVDVTNQLTTLIEKAQTTQKPVRISFDNNISVILKIDKQGKVSAEFIPGSLEAESYLMNNVSALRQKFEEQNLPYTSLSYRQNGQNRQNKNKNKNKGES